VLRVGLSGGIGSGKSSVARALAARGAVLIDADAIARSVLAPGGPGTAAVLARFGPGVVAADGFVDRAALAARVFADPGELAALEAITHPLIWAEAARQFAAVPPDGIAVHDMPLLVEKRMSADYHLVVVVLTDSETRVRRLVEQRGLAEDDARARIRVQASDEQRRAAADVLLTNDGSPQELTAATAALWESRIEPYAANLAARRPARAPGEPAITGAPAAADRDGQGRRIAARVRRALDLPDAPDVVPVWVPTPAGVDELRIPLRVHLPVGARACEALAAAGFPLRPVGAADVGSTRVAEPRLGNCDPGWPVEIVLTD